MKPISRFIVVALTATLLVTGLWVGLEPVTAQADGCCIDQCGRDRDCDRFCGAKGAGVCIRLNSCCTECACLF